MRTTFTIGVSAAIAILMSVSCGKGTSLSGGGKDPKKDADKARNSTDDDGDVKSDDEDDVPNTDPTQGPAGPDQPQKPTLDITKIGYVIGFKDNDAIVATYRALTGVTRTEVLASMSANPTTAAAMFDDLYAQLPGGEEPSLQTGAAQAAKVKLAAHYCDSIGKVTDARRAAVYPNINFAGAMAQLDSKVAAQVVINAFWPADLESVPDMSKSVNDFAAILEEVKTSLPTPLATVENLMLAGCVGALASAQVQMLR
jgi:hypothetical protein